MESKVLRKHNWKLTLPLDVALKTCPENIVALSSSQCLRWIDEINGQSDISLNVRNIQNRIRAIKRKPKSKSNREKISEYYNQLYNLQFQRDYVCVIMENEKEYDKVNEGFSIDFGVVNGEHCIVNYRRFQSTNGGVKKSTIVYVNSDIYLELTSRVRNGRNMLAKYVPAKLESYQGLICSGSTPLPKPKGIIVVKDCITKFKEDVILIDDSCEGEPRLTYEHDYEIEHDDSDGFGFMSPEYSSIVNEYLTGNKEPISGMNTRYAWTKGMVFTFDFVSFAEKVAKNYTVVDVWGTPRDIRNADIILTESMLKLWDSYTSWEEYYDNCEKNHYEFSVAKTTQEEVEHVRDTNYQFLQPYDFTDEEIAQLCKPNADEIADVINLDYRKSLVFLCGVGLNNDNVFNDSTENFVKALMIDKRIIDDSFVRKKIYHLIRKRIDQCKKGAIRVSANYVIISGDPYALAQNMFGLEVTGLLNKGEVYHKYWVDKGTKEIACFRAPMSVYNNIRKMKVVTNDDIEYWYKYINSALIYNAWDSACEAMNGADKDGDTNMCTDNPVIVKNTINAPTIICLQRKAEKKVPTEADIISANKLAFNDEIGVVTNHVTSMKDIQAGYPKNSKEYEVLAYRIMCGQLYQQNTIKILVALHSNMQMKTR